MQFYSSWIWERDGRGGKYRCSVSCNTRPCQTLFTWRAQQKGKCLWCANTSWTNTDPVTVIRDQPRRTRIVLHRPRIKRERYRHMASIERTLGWRDILFYFFSLFLEQIRWISLFIRGRTRSLLKRTCDAIYTYVKSDSSDDENNS